MNFFINSTIPRSIVKKYSLQVLRTLKTGKAFKQGVKHNQFSPQILCLQVSVLIIHCHCFQASYARAQLAKDINLHKKELSTTFRRNIRYMLIIGLSSQIAVRAETVKSRLIVQDAVLNYLTLVITKQKLSQRVALML